MIDIPSHKFKFEYISIYLFDRSAVMPKMKTKRAAAKRFKLTATGKVKIKKANLRHILTTKSQDAKRDKRKAGYLCAKDAQNAKRAIPYMKN
jgi:large subunit ribosomal protein L35